MVAQPLRGSSLKKIRRFGRFERLFFFKMFWDVFDVLGCFLNAFESLNIDASLIDELKTQLNSIRISDLKNLNIAQELAEERLSIIVRFIDSAK